MIGAMRSRLGCLLLILSCWQSPAWAQCAPAPDSPYFFRNLTEQRAEAKLAEDRSFYEGLLSDTFTTKGPDGKTLPREAFIDSELAANRAATRKGFYSVKDFSLLEHRKGFVVASYLLIEGTTGNGETHSTESWRRDVYEVKNGKWRLASTEMAAPASAHTAQSDASAR